jgi:hypothetical protein
MARGEYIGFMDHDDELYPEALERGYAYASAHGADVLNGKEARSNNASWAIEQFIADVPQVLGAGLPYGALRPTNPHKLYRREFLLEHGIRFREGGRVLWEDIFFNVDVLAHAKTVSTLSSTPYYHWHTTSGSGSTTFLRERAEWWHWLDEVVNAIDGRLTDPALEVERQHLRSHQYRDRLIPAFRDRYLGRPAAERKFLFDQARRLQTEHFPEEDDRHLDVSGRLRATLLRRGHPHALRELLHADPTLKPTVTARAIAWDNGCVRTDVDVRWHDAEGAETHLRSDGNRLLKTLPAPLEALFSAEQRDMSEEIATATTTIGVRAGMERIAWLVPGISEVRIDAERPDPRFRLSATAMIDPSAAALGKPLSGNRWDITALCKLGDRFDQPRVRSTLAPAVRVTMNTVQTVHADKAGYLVLDLASENPLAVMRWTGRTRTANNSMFLELEADEVTDGTAQIDLTVAVAEEKTPTPPTPGIRARLRRLLRGPDRTPVGWRRHEAKLLVEDGGVWLALDVSSPLRIRLGATRPEGPRLLDVSSSGVRDVIG